MRWKVFLKENKNSILIRAVFLAVMYGVIRLYEAGQELFLYLVLFEVILILVNGIVFHQNRLKMEAYYRSLEPKNDEKMEEKWILAKEKEDFFAMWTHQIKTPIAALNLLLQSKEPDINQCKVEIFKIEQYVEMALNYLRFDTMSNDLVLEPYNLEGMVKTVVKKHATIFINKRLSISLEDLNYTVLTDDKWFCFVLEQIISNAVKYTKEGGITIFAQKEGQTLVLCVRDTGIGIRKEDLPRIFEKGFTGFNGRLDKKASGLGLYLSEGVCKKLGHELSIESEIGQGTSVYLKVKVETIEKEDLVNS